MQNLHIDAGCVFDTLAFLTMYFDGKTAHQETPCFQRIKDRLADSGKVIPHYLYPFFARVNGHLSFMDLLLFDVTPYCKCTKDSVFRSLKNGAFVYRKYIEHYLHDTSPRIVQRRIAEHPDGIDMVKKLELKPELELTVYYSILRFDEVMPTLYATFERVYLEMETEHSAFISSATEIRHQDKLRALSGAGENDSLQYSFTLMEPRMVSFQPSEPSFFLLGCDFETVLETEYKYVCATPYSFALAIGNPTKYAIYQALQKKSSMTRAEMEISLHISRAALDHNLKAMRDSGLVVMSKRQGDNYYYELDPEIIRAAAEKMLADARIRI